MSNFLPSLNIAGSGLTAQQRRLTTIAENIVNQQTTRTADGEGPYRRQLSVFREITGDQRFSRMLGHSRSARVQERMRMQPLGGVMISEIIECETDFIPVFDPRHPDADEDGYVWMPNVNNTTEMIDGMAATRSYASSLAAFEAMRHIAQLALEIGR